jgi:hypothetical protein
MEPAAQRVRGYHSQQPQNEENNSKCEQHTDFPFWDVATGQVVTSFD